MPTLHIEHPISDLDTWLGAFSRFEQARRGAGVIAQRVAHPVDDHNYIVVQLDFETTDDADNFKSFLETRIWSNPTPRRPLPARRRHAFSWKRPA